MKCFLYFLMQNSYIFNLELIDIMLNSCHGIECSDMNIAFLANALNSLLSIYENVRKMEVTSWTSGKSRLSL